MEIPPPSQSSSKEKPRRQKANPTQLGYLAEYMANHSDMASGLGQSLQGWITYARGWAKLAQELNALGPPVKDVLRWKQAWRDMRNNLKKKAAHNKAEYRGYWPGSTGNGPSTIIGLNATEQQVLGVLGPVSVFGMEEVVETEIDTKTASPPLALYPTPAATTAAPVPKEVPAQPVPPPKSSRKRTRPIVDNFDMKMLKIEEGKLKAEQDRNVIFNRMVDVLQGI